MENEVIIVTSRIRDKGQCWTLSKLRDEDWTYYAKHAVNGFFNPLKELATLFIDGVQAAPVWEQNIKYTEITDEEEQLFADNLESFLKQIEVMNVKRIDVEQYNNNNYEQCNNMIRTFIFIQDAYPSCFTWEVEGSKRMGIIKEKDANVIAYSNEYRNLLEEKGYFKSEEQLGDTSRFYRIINRAWKEFETQEERNWLREVLIGEAEFQIDSELTDRAWIYGKVKKGEFYKNDWVKVLICGQIEELQIMGLKSIEGEELVGVDFESEDGQGDPCKISFGKVITGLENKILKGKNIKKADFEERSIFDSVNQELPKEEIDNVRDNNEAVYKNTEYKMLNSKIIISSTSYVIGEGLWCAGKFVEGVFCLNDDVAIVSKGHLIQEATVTKIEVFVNHEREEREIIKNEYGIEIPIKICLGKNIDKDDITMDDEIRKGTL
ncbi:MAG: hypothetical protein LBN08_00100 [Lactobacillales bacterium]|jgi:hypothetical protein|nr:hypothetical protein [Lactobacillales bacterium]